MTNVTEARTRPEETLHSVQGDRVSAATAADGRSLCWHCREELADDPLCPHCVKIQPLGRGSDYFTVMGLSRKLGIDARVLEPVFHALSRRFHPDVYRLASPRERVIALENSAVLNQAYRTLRDPFDRAAYLLELEHGRAAVARDNPPQDLFEAILEIQELLGDFKLADPQERQELLPLLAARQDQLRAEQERRARELTETVFVEWDRLQDAENPEPARRAVLLERLRALLGERSYLKRVLNSLDDALGRAPI